jgi:hypothetical protein
VALGPLPIIGHYGSHPYAGITHNASLGFQHSTGALRHSGRKQGTVFGGGIVDFEPTRYDLEHARFMPLGTMAATAQAQAFVQEVAADIEGHGTRKSKRRTKTAQETFRRAVAATVADLLVNFQAGVEACRKPSAGPIYGHLSFRPLVKGGFTGQTVSARMFQDVLTALKRQGYVESVKPVWNEFLTARGDPEGAWARRRAQRLLPTDKLIAEAERNGIALSAVRTHFLPDPNA